MEATTTTFDSEAAIRVANEAVDEARNAKHNQLREEAEQIKIKAWGYADHLAAGGDPTEYPDERWAKGNILFPLLGLIAVYREWNRARGSRNPILPFREGRRYAIAERLFASFGEPVPYAELSTLGKGSIRTSSPEVAKIVGRIEEETEGEVVGRRTKVGGKAAFLLRDRRDGDPEVGSYYDLPTEPS